MATTRNVLVVDDDLDCREFVGAVLEKVGNCSVRTAENGKIALEMVRDSKPDLIIMDVMMPEKDGYTTYCELKGQPDTADIQVIMLSSLVEMGGYMCNSPAMPQPKLFVEKPIDPGVLADMVTRILSRS
ncbi:MAG: response regulator [Lentisphaerota bacterium]